MRMLLFCAALAAGSTLAVHAADTAAPQKKAPPKAAPKTAATAPAHKTTVASKPPASKTATKPAVAKPGAPAAHTTTTAHRTAAPAPRRPVTSWRNRQASPTPDRYHEIQAALVSKGYMQADDASGNWNQASVDALKRFQADQNLDSTGKLNSLSIIALGLGPKYDAAPPTKPAETPIGQDR